MKMKIISRKNLPLRLPIYQTLVALIVLDFYNAAQWVWGAVGLLYLFAWITYFVEIFKAEAVDIFKRDDENK